MTHSFGTSPTDGTTPGMTPGTDGTLPIIATAMPAGTTGDGAGAGDGTILTTMEAGTTDGTIPRAVAPQPVAIWDSVRQPSTDAGAVAWAMAVKVRHAPAHHTALAAVAETLAHVRQQTAHAATCLLAEATSPIVATIRPQHVATAHRVAPHHAVPLHLAAPAPALHGAATAVVPPEAAAAPIAVEAHAAATAAVEAMVAALAEAEATAEAVALAAEAHAAEAAVVALAAAVAVAADNEL